MGHISRLLGVLIVVTMGAAGCGSAFMASPSEAAGYLRSGDSDTRREGINLLSNAPFGGEEPYLKAYREFVDPIWDPTVRAAALRALGKHGQPSDVAKIVAQLQDPGHFVRWEAAIALQRIHDAQAVEPLMLTMQRDAQPAVRQAAAFALGQYPQRRVLGALIGALNDADYGVVDQSARSLRILTGQTDFGVDGTPWLAWTQEVATPFADRQTYYYYPFVKPFDFWDTFWDSVTLQFNVQAQVPYRREEPRGSMPDTRPQ